MVKNYTIVLFSQNRLHFLNSICTKNSMCSCQSVLSVRNESWIQNKGFEKNSSSLCCISLNSLFFQITLRLIQFLQLYIRILLEQFFWHLSSTLCKCNLVKLYKIWFGLALSGCDYVNLWSINLVIKDILFPLCVRSFWHDWGAKCGKNCCFFSDEAEGAYWGGWREEVDV